MPDIPKDFLRAARCSSIARLSDSRFCFSCSSRSASFLSCSRRVASSCWAFKGLSNGFGSLSAPVIEALCCCRLATGVEKSISRSSPSPLAFLLLPRVDLRGLGLRVAANDGIILGGDCGREGLRIDLTTKLAAADYRARVSSYCNSMHAVARVVPCDDFPHLPSARPNLPVRYSCSGTSSLYSKLLEYASST